MSHTPIHRPSPATAPHAGAGAPAEGPRACVACAAHHGSVNAGRICLENEVHRLRRQAGELARLARAHADATARGLERIAVLEHAIKTSAGS